MAETNLTMSADITTAAREIDFTTQFERNWAMLNKLLGISRMIRKTPGTQLVSKSATVVLENGAVGEGEKIPMSKASVTPKYFENISIDKYLKGVTLEAIADHGANVALERTDEEFMYQLQKLVFNKFLGMLQKGTLASDEANFQMAVSMAIGSVANEFQKMSRTATKTAVFANTMDVYRYLGSASISTQNAFGVKYLENFLGADTLIMDASIPEGSVIATPTNNIVGYYVDPADSDFARGGGKYRVAGGETNLIGVHTEWDYDTATSKFYAIMGITLWAEYLNGIAKVSFGAA